MVPQRDEKIFKSAEEYISQYFQKIKFKPESGTINLGDERYILIRAASLSYNFLDFLKKTYPPFNDDDAFTTAYNLLYNLAHSFAISDARNFHKKTGVTDPIEKLATGPIHFAYAGWAFVEIHEEARPSSDENFYSIYDHPHSFEADSWIKAKRQTDHCVCCMSAGYSAGWIQESFNISVVTKEILCRARGDKYCRFIMAWPHRIEEFIFKYKKENKHLFQNQDKKAKKQKSKKKLFKLKSGEK